MAGAVRVERMCRVLCEELVDAGREECVEECLRALPRVLERWREEVV